MIIQLSDTTSAKISSAIMRARRNLGTASGLVFTLVVVTDERHYPKTLDACLEAGREHPSRILVVVNGRALKSALNAEIRTGEGVPGEVVTLRMSGELVKHQASVVLPLLLPDSPVVVWWPYTSPDKPSEDLIGALGTRRITDAAGDPSPLKALRIRAEFHSPGDTDLTWTRLTPWRALLAAALDQYPAQITSATVEAARDNAPAALLAAWLSARLGVPVIRKNTRGPGITGVRLTTLAGDVSVLRHPDGLMADYSVPGQPKRLVALKRRGINELITEELRRMDADDIFEQATQALLREARAKPPTEDAEGEAADEARPAEEAPTRPKSARPKASSDAPKRPATRARSHPSPADEPASVTLTHADELAGDLVDRPGEEAPQLDRANAPKDQQ